MHERAGLAFALQVQVQIALRELQERAGRPAPADDPVIRQRFAQLYDRGAGAAAERLPRADRDAEARRARAGGLARQVALGRGQPGADRARAWTSPAPRAQLVDDPWTYRFLRARANSIEGGTTEILKNIVAERVLGLPRAMNFDLTDDQRTIKRTAREFLGRALPARRRSGGSRSRTSAASPTRSGTRSSSSAGRSSPSESGIGRAGGRGRGARLRAARRRRCSRRGRRRCCWTPPARRAASEGRGTVAQWDEDTDGDPSGRRSATTCGASRSRCPTPAAADVIVVDRGRRPALRGRRGATSRSSRSRALDTTRRCSRCASTGRRRASSRRRRRSRAPGTRSRS